MDTAEMSGEKAYKRTPIMKLNEIRLNGKTGEYIFVNLLGDKVMDEKKGKEVYEQKEIGSELELKWLKIRRRLNDFANKMQTTEHNHKEDYVVLFSKEGIERGQASVLREEHQGLRTQQVIYCLYKDELVRLIVRGSSLGSKAKAKDVKSFYEYIQSFEGDDHIYGFTTKCGSVEEESDLGKYYTMTFTRGEEIPKEQMEGEILPKIQELYKHCVAVDSGHNIKVAKEPQTEAEKKYPQEDINPDDIPF